MDAQYYCTAYNLVTHPAQSGGIKQKTTRGRTTVAIVQTRATVTVGHFFS